MIKPKGQAGVGVALYIREGLPCKVFGNCSDISPDFENWFARLGDLLVVAVYRPAAGDGKQMFVLLEKKFYIFMFNQAAVPKRGYHIH